MASDIGPMRAILRLEALDISAPPSKIMQTVNEWDGKSGPITHVYAVSAVSNHLDDERPYDLVRPFSYNFRRIYSPFCVGCNGANDQREHCGHR